MTPHRGAAVSSVPRPWLSIRDIKDAFAAARMNFSDSSVLAIMHNVLDFATRQDTDVPASSVVCDDSHGNKLAAEHFKAYLVHLRLTKKAARPPNPAAAADDNWVFSKTSAASFIPLGEENAGNVLQDGHDGGAMDKRGSGRQTGGQPIQWKEWLGRKCLAEDRARSQKPKEFLKVSGWLGLGLGLGSGLGLGLGLARRSQKSSSV